LEFDENEENGGVFDHSDVSHYCELASEATDQSERAFLLDSAQTILTKLRGEDHDYALRVFRGHLRKYGNADQRRQFGIRGWFLRTKSRLQNQYRYDTQRWFQGKKEAFQSWRTARKNRKFITSNRKEISAGGFDNSNAIWLFERAPDDLGNGTIRAINEEYGHETAQLFRDGLRRYWKINDTSYSERLTYLGHIGLAGVNLDYSFGELPIDANLARKAFRYAFHELNGFPEWVEELAASFPNEFCYEIKSALLVDFCSERGDDDHHVSDCVSKIAYYTVIREQEVAGEKRPDIRLHSRVDALGKVSVEIKLADMKHWAGDQLVNTPGEQLSKQYLFEPSSHTGIYVLVNAARPRKVEKDKKTKKVKRSAFRKSVDGSAVNFAELVALVEDKCAEVNDGLANGKLVVAVTRDISEKPSDTL